MSWSHLAQWWTAQPGWVRVLLVVAVAALVVCWAWVAWAYRPHWRPRLDVANLLRPSVNPARLAVTDAVPRWAGATEGWSPKAEAGAAGQSVDMTTDALAREKLIEAEVRLDVAARLEAADAREKLTIAEAGTSWDLASIDLDKRLARVLSEFSASCGLILEPWQAHVVALAWRTGGHPIAVAVNATARPVKPATGPRARRNRKRINQGKDPR